MTHPSEYYETYWSEGGFFPHGKIWPELRDLYQRWIKKDARVLDVGCGDGLTSGKWLSENGRDYTGVDISENAIREARAFGLNALKIEDATTLPFEGDTFDAVVCIEVLEHLFDPRAAIESIKNSLKPNGIFIATVPNVAYWRTRADFFVLGRWNPLGDPLSVAKPWRDPHIRFFTTSSMQRLIEESGLTLLHIGGQSGGFLKSIPYLRKFSKNKASFLYRFFERYHPALFGYRIEIVCQKPSFK